MGGTKAIMPNQHIDQVIEAMKSSQAVLTTLSEDNARLKEELDEANQSLRAMKAYNKIITDEKDDLKVTIIELQDKAAALTAAATRTPQRALVLQRSSSLGVSAPRSVAQQLPFVVMCVQVDAADIRSDDGTERKLTRLLDACETWLLDTGHVEYVLPVSSTANILLYGLVQNLRSDTAEGYTAKLRQFPESLHPFSVFVKCGDGMADVMRHIETAKHMFGASSYCRAVVYGTKVGKDNQYAFHVINAQGPLRTASIFGRQECALHFTVCGTDPSSHSVDASSVCEKPDDGVSVESLMSKSTSSIVKQQKQPSKPISFSSYIERHATASAKLQDDNASRATSNTSPGSEADTEVSFVRSMAARESKRDEPLKKSTFFGKSTKTVPCRYFFKTGYCHFDERCSFHHNEGEQTELYKKLWKTVDLAVKKAASKAGNSVRDRARPLIYAIKIIQLRNPSPLLGAVKHVMQRAWSDLKCSSFDEYVDEAEENGFVYRINGRSGPDTHIICADTVEEWVDTWRSS